MIGHKLLCCLRGTFIFKLHIIGDVTHFGFCPYLDGPHNGATYFHLYSHIVVYAMDTTFIEDALISKLY